VTYRPVIFVFSLEWIISTQDFAVLLKAHLSVLPPSDCKCIKLIPETADFIYLANVRIVVAGAAAGGTGV